MNIKIFSRRCSLFPSWSGLGLISTPVYSNQAIEEKCVENIQEGSGCIIL